MTTLRFNFQRECCEKIRKQVRDMRFSPPVILNIGCNDDPANLKANYFAINCDIITEHPDPPHYPYNVDKVFDCTKLGWPFDTDSVDLVVLGDIVEHMYLIEFERCLMECQRISDTICITVPKDTRILEDPDYVSKIEGVQKGHVHVEVYSRKQLELLLAQYGFKDQEIQTVDYDFCEEGYFIFASKV